MHLLILACSPAFFHIDHVDKDSVAVEVEDPEGVNQEEQCQEFEVAKQVEEPVPVSDFANIDSQQGKHRFIYPNVLHKFKFMQAPVHQPQCLT